jgi:hypothetical protein
MRRIAAMIVAIVLALGLTSIWQSSASADTVSISKTFSGFEFEKTSVTPAMKAAIQTWVALNADFTEVSCFGYTGYNVFNRSKTFLNKLAVSRAKNTCAFVHRISAKTKVKSTGGIPSTSKNPSSRRVTVTLTRTGIIDPGGTGDGSGTGVIGTCDSNITVKMKSRLLRGDLYFSQISMSDISNNCKSKYMDIYFTDTNGAELSQALNKPVTGATLSLLWSDFSTLELLSTTVARVVISIHD